MDQKLDRVEDEVKQIAAVAGLADMAGSSLQQLAKSIEKSCYYASQLPKDLGWTEEVAFTFRPDLSHGSER